MRVPTWPVSWAIPPSRVRSPVVTTTAVPQPEEAWVPAKTTFEA